MMWANNLVLEQGMFFYEKLFNEYRFLYNKTNILNLKDGDFKWDYKSAQSLRERVQLPTQYSPAIPMLGTSLGLDVPQIHR